jgi:hypothetical protein
MKLFRCGSRPTSRQSANKALWSVAQQIMVKTTLTRLAQEVIFGDDGNALWMSRSGWPGGLGEHAGLSCRIAEAVLHRDRREEALGCVCRGSDWPSQTRLGWLYSEEIALLRSVWPGESSGAAYLTEEGQSGDPFQTQLFKKYFPSERKFHTIVFPVLSRI